MGDGERIKLTIAPLAEQPQPAAESSQHGRSSFQAAAITPERPARLALDADSTPIPSVATSPSGMFRVGCGLARLLCMHLSLVLPTKLLHLHMLQYKSKHVPTAAVA